MKASIQFLGGVGTVTGSKYLLELGDRKILVDCGLFQGLKDLRLQNWSDFPVDPREIDTLLLTHAHLDHSGYIPLLVRNGFAGKILCTAPTRDLAKVILLDSAKIQEEDAERANRLRYTKHSPARPLYTVEDAHRALTHFSPVGQDEWIDLGAEARARYHDAGHILGSSWVELELTGSRRKIVFSGDLGRKDPLILAPPEAVKEADYLLIESTYGDRLHSPSSPLKELARIVNDTLARKGHLIIPAFAVGRTQDVLYLLNELKKQSAIPDVPVFLDSPMGIHATEFLDDYPKAHRLSADELRSISKGASKVKSYQQAEELLHKRSSSIVIAGSGMLTGGRVLRHLAERLPDDRNTVLLVGYQAAGTRGRLLQEGATELKIQGQYVPVRAQIEEISSLSAHADQREILNWLGGIAIPPRRVFVVHGEPQAADALRVKIGDTLGWPVSVPRPMERFELSCE